MSLFHVALLATVILVPGMIFFASWWNQKHGLDEHGDPIEPPPQQHKEPESG